MIKVWRYDRHTLKAISATFATVQVSFKVYQLF